MARPSVLPRWATTGVKVEPTEAKKDAGWLTREKPPAQYENWLLDLMARWIGFFNDSLGVGLLGTGVDGAAVFDGVGAVTGASLAGSTYTLSRDVYYTDATVSAGVTIKTNGFRIFCLGTLTIPATALVHNKGKDGNVGTATGAAAVSGGTAGSLGGGAFSGAGGGHTSGAATAGSARTDSLGGAGGAGGTGDPGTGQGVAGIGGTVAAPNQSKGGLGTLWGLQNGMVAGYNSGTPGVFSILGGAGGGGGGAGDDGVSSGSNGGGGASGGGVIAICCMNLVLDGVISADGGIGGAASIFAGSGYGGGGGGGGGGGVVLVAYFGSRTGAGTITANGGAGGSKGPNGNNDGAAGAAGTVKVVDLSAIGADGPVGLHEESGVGTMSASGSGDGVDYLDVVFDSAFADTSYRFTFDPYSSAGSIVPLTLILKTTTMMRIKPVAPFDGEISWSAKVLS